MADPIPFPFKADWSESITERLSWLTVVMASRTGAEQREALRIHPRRQLDYPLNLYGQERVYFDVLMARNGGGKWNVPLPQEEILYGAISAGETTFDIDPTFREIAVGTKLLLRQDWTQYEIVEVTGLSPLTTTPTELAYTAASVTPTFVGVISEAVTSSRRTARVSTATVRFQSVEPTILPGLDPDVYVFFTMQPSGYDTAFAFWMTPPNAVNDLDYTYERMFTVADNDISLPVYTDKANRQFTTQKYEFFLYGKQERYAFRTQLYALRGRLMPVWMPTFNDDLTAGESSYPDPNGYGNSPPLPGREWYVRLGTDNIPETAAPAVALARATTAATSYLPEDAYSDSTYYQSSFVSLKRLDVDEIEIQHYADLEGVATCSVIFRDAPYLRKVATAELRPFDDAVYHTADGTVTPTNDPNSLVETHTIITGV